MFQEQMETAQSFSNGQTGRTDFNQNNALDARFECPICLSYLKEPYITSCGHRFCNKCIHDWFNKQGSYCPIDGSLLNLTKDLFPDNYTRREISQLTLECSYPGCGTVWPVDKFENHEKSHDKNDNTEESILCTFKNLGCNLVFKHQNQMLAHVERCVPHHLQLLASSFEMLSVKKAKSSSPVNPPDWDPPPKGGNILMDKSVESLLKPLYERIVVLEQKTAEKDLQLEALNKKLKQAHEDRLQFEHDISLKLCNGTYIWNIPDMEETIGKCLQCGTNELLYSEGFYTSYYGYRFCAKITLPSREKFLALHIHVMKGEYDHVLIWPFTGRIAFTIIHPTDPSKSVREVMCSSPNLEAFKRSLKPINTRGFGYLEFIPISDLKSRGFYDNLGSIVIKIEINVV